jgi:hypothetical protein
MATTPPGQVEIDYIAKDFNSVVDALINFATAQFGPGTASNRLWTDFNVDSFSRTWLELVAFVSDIIFFYLDNQSTEAYLASATLQSSIIKIAQQFGYIVPTAQSSGGIATFTTTGATTIPAGFILNDVNGTAYFTTQAGSIGAAGTLNIPVLQGSQANDTFSAMGLQSESFALSTAGIVIDTTNAISALRSPIVTVNGVTWTQVNSFINSYPTSKNYQISIADNGTASIVFGDGIFGAQLNLGDQVQVSYRTGGGTIGNIQPPNLNTLISTAPNVISVTNANPLSGGSDAPTLNQLRSLIPASLSTLNRAVTPQDHADLILLNFPQVAQAAASISNTETGIDLNIYVVPVGSTVTPLSANPNLSTSIGSFLAVRKMVTSQLQLLNGNNLALQLSITAYLESNATRSVVEANILSTLAGFFNFGTGTISSNDTGPTFGQEILLSDVFGLLETIEGVSRFEINQLTYQPRVEARNVNINPLTFANIQALPNAKTLEYFIVTETVPPNEDGNSIGQYEVFQREYFTASNITDNSINDQNADFSVLTSTGTLTGTTLVDTGGNIFIPHQYARGFLVVDSNGNVFKIVDNGTNNITINVTAVNPTNLGFANGQYYIVNDLRDRSAGGVNQNSLVFNNQVLSIQYNNVNTVFVIVGAGLLNIGTLGDTFIVSTKLTNTIVQSNVIDTTAFPTVQLNPVVVNDLYMRFASGQYSAYNPLTGEIDVENSVDLSSVIVGDQFVDSTGNTYPILGSVNNTPNSKSFLIQGGIELALPFTPTSYNGSTGLLSVPNSVDLSVVNQEDVFIDATNTRYVILGGVNNTPNSKSFLIQAGLSPNLTVGATIYRGISQLNSLAIITPPFVPVSYTSGTGVVVVPNTVNLTTVSPGDVFVDFSNNSFQILAVNPGSYNFTIAEGETVNISGNCDIYPGADTPKIVGLGSLNLVTAGDILIDSQGTVCVIDSVNVPANQVVINVNSRKPATGTCQLSPPDQCPIPIINTSITATAQSDVFLLRSPLIDTLGTGKIIAGDLLIDQMGVANEILKVPYESFSNPSPTPFVYTLTPKTVTVFNNSAPVAFTYTSATGIIQYASTVDLSGVDIGDQFEDYSGNFFTIANVNYAGNAVTIPTGQTVNTVSGSYPGGSILNGSGRGLIQYANPYATATDTLDTPNIIFTANVPGYNGQNISLVFNGSSTVATVVNAWNTANPTNTVSYTGLGTVVPTAQTVNLAIQVLSVNLSQVLIGDYFRDGTGTEFVIETLSTALNLIRISTAPTSIGTVAGTDFGGSIRSYNKVQLKPGFTPPTTGTGATLTRRYFSPGQEVTWRVSYNGLSAKAGFSNINEIGNEPGTQNVADQFTIRTSPYDDDITNVRDDEIPTLNPTNIVLNLKGGNS